MFGFGRKKASASARHILVKDEALCKKLKDEIEAGTDFAQMAKQYSHCPSGKQGGDLGTFREGQMVKAFNDFVFSAEPNKIHGPIQTQFGYHLIEIISRSDAN